MLFKIKSLKALLVLILLAGQQSHVFAGSDVAPDIDVVFPLDETPISETSGNSGNSGNSGTSDSTAKTN